MVYGITDCPACMHAQAELMSRDEQYVFVNADFSAKYRSDIREDLGWPTFPIITNITEEHEERLIGGYDEMMLQFSYNEAPT